MAKELLLVEGLPALEKALASKVAELRAGATMAVAEEVALIESDARGAAPRDTGELAGSIESEVSETSGTVRTESRHAGFMEFGTFKDEAQPFMHPAAEKARRRFPKRAADIIRAALGG